MVLGDLGSKLVDALGKLQSSMLLDDGIINQVIKDICLALIQADVNIQQVNELRQSIKRSLDANAIAAGHNKRVLVRQAVVEALSKMFDPGHPPFQPKRGRTNIIMFVGLQGSGKTTTVAKYANFYKKKGFKCAVVCADTFRAGAFSQLQQNAAKVRVPFYGEQENKDPVAIALAGVRMFTEEGFDLIIVDTSGRHMQDTELFEEMKQVADAIHPNDIVFVMDSSIGQAAHDQALAFRQKVNITSVVVTKLDGHAKGGGALVAATQSPIVFLGVGEGFDQMELFNTHSFISRLLGMGDVQGLVAKMEEMDLEKKHPELIQNLTEGRFTYKDLRSVLETFMQAGSLTQMMDMMPGPVGKFFHDMQGGDAANADREGFLRLKGFMTIMDSMTEEELNSVKPLTATRVSRLARGSGQHSRMVQALIEAHKLFSRFGSQLKGLGINPAGDINPRNLNPQTMRKMMSMMPQQALKQMGGMGGMQNMLKQMASMGRGMGGMGGMGGLGGLGGMFGGGG
ncbi:putative Signal recognition particle 54 kDa protein 2 [Paratrimastix pyriformis]|uniref:signal-recognition-particle GTPase n=1 Tax=Paratrimastix pyriformis TaxID=342808 RepID=A0ABQ8UQT5_9EUKA|nr:putative Signal recognition particle 54 kDa protein 2 [Paratrimastix pyriformis]